MDLTIGVLSWAAHKTLENSLNSWGSSGILPIADRKLIFFQEISPADIQIAQEWGFEFIGADSNIGIAKGYTRLVEETTSDLFLFLENDWVITNPDPYPNIKQIVAGMTLLDTNMVDVVRYRSRHNHGYPLWTLQYDGHERDKMTHLLDCVHWRENPEQDFQEIDKTSEFYTAYASHANWTNNPTMFRTNFLRKNILPRMGDKDIERDLQDWWQTQSFLVAQGEGLFTHYRID